jgi:TMEM175 potassium channel family protein
MAGPRSERVVHQRETAEVEFSRIVAFSDGVFAIAITLLVLALEIPSGSDVVDEIRARGDEFFAYFLSFAVVGRFWMSHHRMFGALARFDNGLIALNLAYLAFVALIPFASEVLGDYSGESAGVALYAANLTLVTAFSFAIIRYAARRELLRAEEAGYRMRRAGVGSLVVTAVFAASIPIAYLSPTLATISWASLFVIGDRLSDRLAGPPD